MSSLLRGETQYDPNQEYFFVDYSDQLECRWIRCPYMSLDEVLDLISNHLPFVYDHDERKCVPMFSNLRVTPMSKLEELHQNWNQETGKYEDDEITVLRLQFGSSYDGYEWIRHPSMLPSLTKKAEETAEEWKSRIEVQREELKKRRNKRNERLRAYEQKARANYPDYRLALLEGRMMRHEELNSFDEEE